MVLNTADGEPRTILISTSAMQISMQFTSQRLVLEPRRSVLGRIDDMNVDLHQRHDPTPFGVDGIDRTLPRATRRRRHVALGFAIEHLRCSYRIDGRIETDR